MRSISQLLEPAFDLVLKERPTIKDQRALVVAEFEKHAILVLIEANLGNLTRSAEQAGMSWSGFRKLMKKHKIDHTVYINEYTYLCPDHTENPQ